MRPGSRTAYSHGVESPTGRGGFHGASVVAARAAELAGASPACGDDAASESLAAAIGLVAAARARTPAHDHAARRNSRLQARGAAGGRRKGMGRRLWCGRGTSATMNGAAVAMESEPARRNRTDHGALHLEPREVTGVPRPVLGNRVCGPGARRGPRARGSSEHDRLAILDPGRRAADILHAHA